MTYNCDLDTTVTNILLHFLSILKYVKAFHFTTRYFSKHFTKYIYIYTQT